MDHLKLMSLQTGVALSLSKHLLSTKPKDSNLVFSPLSLYVVLSLLASGSKGPTLNQFLSFLKSKSTDHLSSLSSHLVSVVLSDGSALGGPKLSAANGVWIDKSLSLRNSFKQVVDKVFKASSYQVDFQTKAAEVVNEVNSWAEKETNGLIKEALPPGSVSHITRVIFANALYFKGNWTEKFDKTVTEDNNFYLLNGSSVRAPFMTSKKKQFVSAFEGFKVLRLPYKQGEDKRQFSMYIFLPDARDGLPLFEEILPLFEEKLGSESRFLERYLPMHKVAIGDFKIPRFKISFGFEASNTLKELGLVLPFSNEADFTEMAESSLGENPWVSAIYHKAFIEVNEEGTEAAATSVTVMYACSASSRKKVIDFVADHPFLFMIREDISGVVLFIGQVLDPLRSD